MLTALLPPLTLMTSLLAAVLIFATPEHRSRFRTGINLGAALIKLILVAVMVWGVFHGVDYQLSFPVLPGVTLSLRADALSVMFAGLSAILWLLTTLYAVGYLEDSPNRSRFFGFFSLCVGATAGLAMAGNLFTFLLFYEVLNETPRSDDDLLLGFPDGASPSVILTERGADRVHRDAVVA